MVDRVWGVSRLKDLHQCPRMFVAKYEWKRWVEAPSEAMDRGTRIHKLLENSITYDLALPDELASVNDFVSMLVQMKQAGAAVCAEFKFGLDKSYNRCDFFKAPGLRARVMMDVYVNDNGNILVIDWKTGKYKPEHRQEGLFYGAASMVAAKAHKATVMYVYTDHPEASFDLPIDKPEAIMTAAWDSFDKADAYLDGVGKNGALRTEEPPVNTGKHCGWCGDLSCPHNENDKAKAWQAAQADVVNLKDLFK